jgi:undecaprenyl-diphosphatase
VCVTFASLVTAGCLSPDNQARVGRHFDGDPWGGAMVQTVEEPSQWAPVAALVVATPLLRHRDKVYEQNLEDNHSVTGSSTTTGDTLMVALAAASAGVAGWKWYDGDHAQALEVATESFVLTAVETSLIKSLRGRPRPHDGVATSFPGGHSSFSFAAATFLARTIWASADPAKESFWIDAAGWACYVPAALVALNRVETGRHYPSDVTAGAALGILTTNLVWNAHYGDSAKKHESIFKSEHPVSATLSPLILEDGVGLLLQVRF